MQNIFGIGLWDIFVRQLGGTQKKGLIYGFLYVHILNFNDVLDLWK